MTALLGPRQCGKTTLARSLAPRPEAYFDLEDPLDLARLEAPRQALGALEGLVVLDEIQRRPELFPLLRVLADREGRPARFLVLGSASLDLVKGVSESLAGRFGFVDLSGFDATEVGFDRLDALWLRGGFPASFLSDSDEASLRWRQQFIRTFLARDIPQLGISVPTEQLYRSWLMVAHYHGRPGMPPRSPPRSGSATRPRSTTWTSSPARSWSAPCRPGPRTSASACARLRRSTCATAGYADAPRTTKSMRVALDDLRLEHLFVVYPGEKDYALDDRIRVLALRNVGSVEGLQVEIRAPASRRPG